MQIVGDLRIIIRCSFDEVMYVLKSRHNDGDTPQVGENLQTLDSKLSVAIHIHYKCD